MRSAFQDSAGYKPNVVIINCGFNDANIPVEPWNAGIRMRGVLNDIWSADGMEDACIMLSTLIPTSSQPGASNREDINAQYRDIITDPALAGKCLYLADMDPPYARNWIDINKDITADGVHPNVR
jgi:hypothetical protein